MINYNRLSNYFFPNSVAVIGVSTRANSSGRAIVQNILTNGFKGKLFLINKNGGEHFGLPVLKSLTELEKPVDLAIIAVKAEIVTQVLLEEAIAGIKNFLVLPGGFSEADEIGLAREVEIKKLIKQYDIRILGPNCAGFSLNFKNHIFSATFFRAMLPGGSICCISQSGALIEEIIAYSRQECLALGAVVSVGNCMNYDINDFVNYFGNLPTCSAILIYAEGALNIKKLALARSHFPQKPVIVLWEGKSNKGKNAALHHTGKKTLYSQEISHFCKAKGIFIVNNLRELLLILKGLTFYARLIARKLVIVSNSGGPAVLLTDSCEAEKFDLPTIPKPVQEFLKNYLPSNTSLYNPIDLLADADYARFDHTFNALAPYWREVFDAILTIQVIPAMIDADPIIDLIAQFARLSSVPILACMLGSLEKKETWKRILAAAGIGFFNDPEDAVLLLKLLNEMNRVLRLSYEYI